LVDRSISAADAIGKTADKIRCVEALQEPRFAAGRLADSSLARIATRSGSHSGSGTR
jgi:hypothetical protein